MTTNKGTIALALTAVLSLVAAGGCGSAGPDASGVAIDGQTRTKECHAQFQEATDEDGTDVGTGGDGCGDQIGGGETPPVPNADRTRQCLAACTQQHVMCMATCAAFPRATRVVRIGGTHVPAGFIGRRGRPGTDQSQQDGQEIGVSYAMCVADCSNSWGICTSSCANGGSDTGGQLIP